jgi:MFS family permease
MRGGLRRLGVFGFRGDAASRILDLLESCAMRNPLADIYDIPLAINRARAERARHLIAVAPDSDPAGSPVRGQPASSPSTTPRIIATSALIALCYLTIGLQLAVVPPFVHLQLGYSPLVAGLAISAQYAATLSTRPLAGRTADVFGAKRATCIGLVVCAAAGFAFLLTSYLQASPSICLAILIVSRLLLGFGESWVATGAIVWGIGRVGAASTAQVISWAGIASYGALAAGAPLGLWLESRFGLSAIGLVSVVAAATGLLAALTVAAVPILAGDELPFGRVLRKIFPHGISLTLAGIGFGTIASFITLYYASRHWQNAGLALGLFGVCFVAARLLFVRTIDRWGGFPVAIVSLAVQCSGLMLLWLATQRSIALAGAALSGLGFALVFPALGVEAVRKVPQKSRGSALGIYTAFIDLSIGISGPIAGVIVASLGYAPIFLFATAMAAGSALLVIALWRHETHQSNQNQSVPLIPEFVDGPFPAKD